MLNVFEIQNLKINEKASYTQSDDALQKRSFQYYFSVLSSLSTMYAPLNAEFTPPPRIVSAT
ncbi:MAG: hypothetical protein FWG98_00435 [Candidatus Cloacimonetes bacterium]|nr:hypothetical protein [Candidatus Cloacimonadota bacterium]